METRRMPAPIHCMSRLARGRNVLSELRDMEQDAFDTLAEIDSFLRAVRESDRPIRPEKTPMLTYIKLGM